MKKNILRFVEKRSFHNYNRIGSKFQLNKIHQKTTSFINCNIRQFTIINKPGEHESARAKDDSEAAAMQNAREFLNDIKSHVDEVTDYQQWMPKVMQSDIPVILDCYADWCAPCRKLTPVLENLAVENEGKFRLVKLNIDTLPQIANGLKIKSIPAVFLIHKGNVLDTFNGIPKDEKLKDFINTAVLLNQISSDENVIKTLIEQAEKFLEENKLEEAEKMFKEGWDYENWRNQFGPQFLIGQAYCLVFKDGEVKKAHEMIQKLTDPQKKNLDEKYKHLLGQVETEIITRLSTQKPSEQEIKLQEKVDNDPSDLQSLYDLAILQKDKEKYQDAIDSCLQILAIQRNWNNKAAHNLLMEIFAKVGSQNEIVIKARKRLSKILF